jgi:protein TonB
MAKAQPPERPDMAYGVEGGVEGGVPGGVPGSTASSLDEAATVYRVGGPVTAPEPVHRVPPAYPEAARRAGLRGVVVIEVVIDRDGAVVRPRVVRNTTGSSECAEEALRAVRKWRYRPAQLEGRPVAAHLTLAIEFRPGTTGHKATAGPQPP